MSDLNLMTASSQWANRPADQRFESPEALHAAALQYRNSAAEKSGVNPSTLRVEAVDNEIKLVGRGNMPSKLTNWSFGQLCNKVEAPASYLRNLTPTLAAQNLNFGLSRMDPESETVKILGHGAGDEFTVDALTSDRYTRIWNSDITSRLLDMSKSGWRTPPARPAFPNQPGTRQATIEDVLANRSMGLSIQVGDMIAPAGLYMSDRDMFAFFVNEDIRIAEEGNPAGLSRGFFVGNSMVGAQSFFVTRFLYRTVCGNHIVWGASQVSEIRFRHIGNADGRAFMHLGVELRKYAEQSASADEARIYAAQHHQIAATKDEVLDFLFGKKVAGKKVLEAAYDLTEIHTDTDGSPRTSWGMAQGLTRLSQESSFADERIALDRAAGKILEMAF